MSNHKPIVKVIGFTTFLGVPEELKSKGIGNLQDWGSDGARLIECAGRTCYDSYGVGRGSEEYHKHILDVGHGCYDGETEVLTKDGWKFFKDTYASDEFATINKNGGVEYHYATEYFEYKYSGRMYRVESPQVDLLVTPNHNMYVCMTTTKEGRKKANFSLQTAEEIGIRSHCYLKSGEWLGGKELDVDIAKLLGFAIGDGYLGEKSKRLEFHLTKQRKIEYLYSILTEPSEIVGWEFWRDGDWYYIRLPDEYVPIFRSMYDDKRQKQIPPGFLTFYDRNTQEGLLDGLVNSDGSVNKKTGYICYDTTSPILANQFQQLAMHVGLSANVCYVIDKSSDNSSFGDKPVIRLSLIQRNNKPEVNKWSGAHGKSYWVDDWSGIVYCVEVPNHTLYVRRNGIPVWCGNSVLEHAVINFFISNVSRGCTHELVRHRVGVAISQRSTRYVDESKSPWVFHPLINEFIDRVDENSYHVEDTIIEARQRCQDAYEVIVEHLQDYLVYKGTDKLTARKQARGAARGALGNALSTELVWSANIRAIRHFIEMRATEFADAEIRLVANEVYKQARIFCPEYFSDYITRPCSDGIGLHIETKNRKV